MNILILGATGRTGSILAKMAVTDGHSVTAIIRNRDKATVEGVNYIEGSVTDTSLLEKSLEGMDAAVVCLNVNRKSDNPFSKVVSPLTIISGSVQALVAGMEKQAVRRVISISAYGVGDSWKNMPLLLRGLFRISNIHKAYLDHDRQERLLRQPGLEWTILRPVMLSDRENEDYTATTGKPSSRSISRHGMARFILDELRTGKYIHKVVNLNG